MRSKSALWKLPWIRCAVHCSWYARRGCVLYLNRRAKTVLSQQRSLFIHRGKLMARNPGDTASLGALIEKATNTAVGRFPAGGGAMAIRREEGRPLHVLVSPISRDDPAFPQNTAAAVFLDDPELQPLIPEEVLRTLFRLSPAEARLALSIVDGQSISAAAERVDEPRDGKVANERGLPENRDAAPGGTYPAAVKAALRAGSMSGGRARIRPRLRPKLKRSRAGQYMRVRRCGQEM